MNAENSVSETAPREATPRKGRSGLMLFVVLLLAAAGGGAWFFLHAGGMPKAHASKAAPKAPLYVALDPPFVVNFEAEQLVRFLQITVEVMSRDPLTIDLIKANDPVIRNDLLLLFGNQRYETIATREGKEQLRTNALGTVKQIVADVGGNPEQVEAVYFTSFVMQ